MTRSVQCVKKGKHLTSTVNFNCCVLFTETRSLSRFLTPLNFINVADIYVKGKACWDIVLEIERGANGRIKTNQAVEMVTSNLPDLNATHSLHKEDLRSIKHPFSRVLIM